MVSQKELGSRVKEFFMFSPQEITGLIAAIVVTGFIFSFRDWGEERFDLVIGLTHLFTMFLICAITFFGRLSIQKIYALREGYKVEFKIWWAGLITAFILGLLTAGRLPIVLIGGVVAAFMVKQRIGEFRYGFSLTDNSVISLWGVMSNMVLAIIFAVGAYFVPDNYFFTKGLLLNIIMGFTMLLPLPQLEGLNIFFGSRSLYYIAITMVLLAAVLLLTGTRIGLIIALVVAVITGIVMTLITSEK